MTRCGNVLKNQKTNPHKLWRGYVTLMTYVTRTYDMKVLGLPTPALKSGAAPLMGACGGAVSGYGVLGFSRGCGFGCLA